jgi:hypothetical protein
MMFGKLSGFLPFDEGREDSVTSIRNIPYRITDMHLERAGMEALEAMAFYYKGQGANHSREGVASPDLVETPEDMDRFFEQQILSSRIRQKKEITAGKMHLQDDRQKDNGHDLNIEKPISASGYSGEKAVHHQNRQLSMSTDKNRFLSQLSDKDKILLQKHFNTVYLCTEFGEREFNLGYFAWLWHLGLVGEDEYGLTWVDELKAEFDPAALEWPIGEGEASEVFDPNAVYAAYRLHEIPALLDWGKSR